MKLSFSVPLRLGRGQNGSHSHWAVKYRQAEREQFAIKAGFPRRKVPDLVMLPVHVRMTRVSPGTRKMDFDNLVSALKYVRDQMAAEFRVDDGDGKRIQFEYAQRRGPWGVDVEVWDSTQEELKCL